MESPKIWIDSEQEFRSRINAAATKVDAMKYVHICVNYFIDAGCNEDEVDYIERLMKSIVSEWAHDRFGHPQQQKSSLTDLDKNMMDIKFFEPETTYYFKCKGQHAARSRDIIARYERGLASARAAKAAQRKERAAMWKEPIALKLVKIGS
jgi:hypothetical protein